MRYNAHHRVALMNACYNAATLCDIDFYRFHQLVSSYGFFHFHGVDIGQRLAYWVQFSSLEKLLYICCLNKLFVEAIFNHNLKVFAHFIVRITFEI